MGAVFRILGPSSPGREMTSTSDPRETEGPRFCTTHFTMTSRNIGVDAVCRTSSSCTARSKPLPCAAGDEAAKPPANAALAAAHAAMVRALLLPVDIVLELRGANIHAIHRSKARWTHVMRGTYGGIPTGVHR